MGPIAGTPNLISVFPCYSGVQKIRRRIDHSRTSGRSLVPFQGTFTVSRMIEVYGRKTRHSRAIERTSMETGTVKFFNNQKGYGFISPDKGGNDVFVHISAVERAGLRSLSEGQKVTYDTEQDRRTGKPTVKNIATA